MSDGESELIMEIRILIAKLEERIIFLNRSNSAVQKSIGKLREEQETRFRWTIYLFITLLLLFIGLTPVIWKIGIGLE